MESNFDFLKYSELHQEALRSEGLSKKAIDYSLLSARKTLEYLMNELFAWNLWPNDTIDNKYPSLKDKIHYAFNRNKIDESLKNKLNFIREKSNIAVHNINRVDSDEAFKVIQELFDVCKHYHHVKTKQEINIEFDFDVYYQISKEFILDPVVKNFLDNLKVKIKFFEEKDKENEDLIQNLTEQIKQKDDYIKDLQNQINVSKINETTIKFEIKNVGFTEVYGKIWGRVFINFVLNYENYFAVRYWQPDWQGDGKAKEHFVITKGNFEESPLYTLFPCCHNDFDLQNILDGKIDNQFQMISYSFKHLEEKYVLPSKSMKLLKNYLENNFKSSPSSNHNQTIENPEFQKIMNFPNYFSAGEIEYGIHGPEIENGKLYISVYHFLEFHLLNPRCYNTFSIGNEFSKLTSNYKTCKYKSQNFTIGKYDWVLLKNNWVIFERYKKV